MLQRWVSSRLQVPRDLVTGQVPTGTTDTATSSNACLTHPTLLVSSLSYDLFPSLAEGFVPKLPQIFIREKTPNHTHKLISSESPIESFDLSYYIL